MQQFFSKKQFCTILYMVLHQPIASYKTMKKFGKLLAKMLVQQEHKENKLESLNGIRALIETNNVTNAYKHLKFITRNPGLPFKIHLKIPRLFNCFTLTFNPFSLDSSHLLKSDQIILAYEVNAVYIVTFIHQYMYAWLTHIFFHFSINIYTRKQSPGFSTRSNTNRAAQPQKMVRDLKFWI